LLLLLLLGAACGDDEAAPPDPSLVTTGSGALKGLLKTDHRAFLGVPYAAPPVGALRFAPPAAHAGWSGVRDATVAGNICPQLDLGLTKASGTQDEDCLFINVYTPLPAPDRAPVMVWIHGGGFVMGSSTEAAYDGHALAGKMGVVLVTLNYRLGPLGFLAHKALGKGSGNHGLKDQQAALRWVQRNISAFGGDPSSVTLFGQSAGSVSVCAHITSPTSAGLFHRAILQSGACSSGTTALSLSAAEAQGQKLAAALKCDAAADPLACLRGKKAQEVNKALALKKGLIIGAGATWGPIVDGTDLPDLPMKRLQAGTFNKVPIMAGVTKDEGTIFLVSGGLLVMKPADFDTLLEQVFGKTHAAKVKAQYPLSGYGDVSEAAADLIGDAGFICPVRRTLRAVTAAGLEAHAYRFTRTPSFYNMPFLRCFHGADLGFVFGNPQNSGFDAGEKTLSAAIMGYWTRFAKTGDPNGGGAVSWPGYDKPTDQHLQLDLTIKTAAKLKQARCDFWDTMDF